MIGRLDRYVGRICLGSFVVCLCFIVGLFVVIDFLEHVDNYAKAIPKLPDEYRRLGYFLVGAYYLSFLPFIYMQVAPFVTVTAGMFAVSRLMGSNEVVPMIFCGRRLGRVLVPIFAMGVLNLFAMIAIRQFVLPKLVDKKDHLYAMIREGDVDQYVDAGIINLPKGNTLFFEGFSLREGNLKSPKLYIRRDDDDGVDSLRARMALWTKDGDRGPGWILEAGLRRNRDAEFATVIDFVPAAMVEGFEPGTIRNRIKEKSSLLDLSYGDLAELVREHPNVVEYSVGLHHNITFPIANILLLLLALPFALKFERGSKIERVVFALLICGAYLVVDLSLQNLGRNGAMSPVLAAWLPTLVFGSLGVVIFDTVRT
ncbi:MAG: LptF/LptG family permease [Planctomycetes bacterium]|nr:LptF/LptG family permease [Planctomycetota bacterium]MCB9920372.1 LptF/LptG family permease [Planctomycetota bacterium]